MVVLSDFEEAFDFPGIKKKAGAKAALAKVPEAVAFASDGRHDLNERKQAASLLKTYILMAPNAYECVELHAAILCGVVRDVLLQYKSDGETKGGGGGGGGGEEEDDEDDEDDSPEDKDLAEIAEGVSGALSSACQMAAAAGRKELHLAVVPHAFAALEAAAAVDYSSPPNTVNDVQWAAINLFRTAPTFLGTQWTPGPVRFVRI